MAGCSMAVVIKCLPRLAMIMSHPLQDPVIGFARAADKDNLFREATQQFCHLGPGLLQTGSGALP